LREGRIVALVSDQGVKGLASAFVQFFGRPAKTPRGAAVFAHRFESPAMFFAAVRLPTGKYWMHIRPVPVERGGDREREIDEIVAAYTRVLESFVRRYPEQYFWLHRRWRRQPPDTPPELRDPVALAAAIEPQ
jgi:KDO2-lipid IV(A) lauroyltransferase